MWPYIWLITVSVPENGLMFFEKSEDMDVMEAHEQDDVLTFKEFMEFIKVKKSTMYKIMQSSRAPRFTKIGSMKIITRNDAVKWVEENAGNVVI